MKYNIKLKYPLIIIFLLFAFLFYFKDRYFEAVTSLVLVVVMSQAERLKNIKLGRKGISADFNPPSEKIKEDIIDNEEEPTKERFEEYRDIESRAIKAVYDKFGGQLVNNITFSTGGDAFRPDATIKNGDDLIFLEIKNITSANKIDKITKQGIEYLSVILAKWQRFTKTLTFKAKLILVSEEEIDVKSFKCPGNIEIISYKYSDLK